MVFSSGRQGGLMKCVDQRAFVDPKGDMNARSFGVPSPIQKSVLGGSPKPATFVFPVIEAENSSRSL